MELRPTPLAPARQRTTDGLLGALAGAVLAVLIFVVVLATRDSASRSDEGAARARDVAVKLEAAGLTQLAASSWARWLGADLGEPAEQATIASRLGSALVDQGRFEEGLRFLYEAEAIDESALPAEHAAKVVHALEALGRGQAAKATLASRTRIDPPAGTASNEADPVVAEVDGEAIRRSRIDDALAELPPAAAKSFEGPQGRQALLQRVVGEELLWRRARRLELDGDPEVRRRIDLASRRVLVATWLERQALGEGPSTSDLETFWKANQDRYRPEEGAEPLPLEQIRPVVEQDWRMHRLESAWRDAVEKELSSGSVTLHPERLAGGSDG